jgi:hypothetical protein
MVRVAEHGRPEIRGANTDHREVVRAKNPNQLAVVRLPGGEEDTKRGEPCHNVGVGDDVALSVAITPDPRPLPVSITTTDGLTRLITAMNWSSRVVAALPPRATTVGVVREAGTGDSPPPQEARVSAARQPASKCRYAATDDRLTSQSSAFHQGSGA